MERQIVKAALPPNLTTLGAKASPNWLRHLVVGGVVLASILVAPRRPDRTLLVLAAAVVLLIFFRWPSLGLVALVFAGLLLPYGLSTGTGTDLNLAVLLPPVLVALWVVELLARDRLAAGARWSLSLASPMAPLLALCLVATAAFVYGSRPLMSFAATAPLPAQVGGLGIFWIAAMAFLLAGYRVPALPWLPRITWLYLALAGFYVFGRLLPGGLLPVDRFYVGAATANSLFWVWAVALAAGQSLANKTLRMGWRLALAGIVLAVFFVAFFQARSWVSGWLPALVALVATLWMSSPRLAVAASVLGGLVLLFDQAIVLRAIDSLLRGENTYSLITRLEAWRVLAEVIKFSPVLGLGPANYYWYTPLFPILGWRVNFSSHNNFVDVAAQTGILGLLCLLWFALSLARLALRLRKTAPAGFERAYVHGVFGGLLGTMVAGMLADWFLPFVYNIGLSGFRMSLIGWIFLGGLVALTRPRPASGGPTCGGRMNWG